MKQLIYLSIALFIFVSCGSTPDNKESDPSPSTEQIDGLEITKHTDNYTHPKEADAADASTYTVEWLEIDNATEELKNSMKDLYDMSMRSYNGALIGTAAKADSFFAGYDLFKGSLADQQTPTWSYHETYKIASTTSNVVTLNKMVTESKANAQPMTNTEFINFDRNSGFIIPFNRIVPDSLIDSLDRIAEPYFIAQQQVDLSKGWVNAGYLFYSGFKTNNNYILGEDSIIFVYNPYEIVDNPTTIIRFSVPNSAIKPIAAEFSEQWLK